MLIHFPIYTHCKMLIHFPIKNCLRLYERRASPTRRDPAVDKARSRLIKLEISHINAIGRAGPLNRAE